MEQIDLLKLKGKEFILSVIQAGFPLGENRGRMVGKETRGIAE